MTDAAKLLIVGAIMAVIALGSTLMEPAVTEVTEVATDIDVNLFPPRRLEMLNPLYSEKAAYGDDLIRVHFDLSQNERGVESKLVFGLHNNSMQPIAVIWDLCSMQLPDGNTSNVIHKGQRAIHAGLPTVSTSVAPGGDLFDVLVPTSEILPLSMDWFLAFSADNGRLVAVSTETGETLDEGLFMVFLADEGRFVAYTSGDALTVARTIGKDLTPLGPGWSVTTDILEGGTFSFLLAIEVARELRYYNFELAIRP